MAKNGKRSGRIWPRNSIAPPETPPTGRATFQKIPIGARILAENLGNVLRDVYNAPRHSTVRNFTIASALCQLKAIKVGKEG
jgi:hypothetical protein